MSRADLWCLIEDINVGRTLACVVHPADLPDAECPAEWNYLLVETSA